MNEQELAALCSEIQVFLQGAAGRAVPEKKAECSLTLWHSRPYITGAELEVFAGLGSDLLDGETLAHRLGRDLPSARVFLDALVAIGVLQRCGERYGTTPATEAYLKAFLDR